MTSFCNTHVQGFLQCDSHKLPSFVHIPYRCTGLQKSVEVLDFKFYLTTVLHFRIKSHLGSEIAQMLFWHNPPCDVIWVTKGSHVPASLFVLHLASFPEMLEIPTLRKSLKTEQLCVQVARCQGAFLSFVLALHQETPDAVVAQGDCLHKEKLTESSLKAEVMHTGELRLPELVWN